MLELPVTVCLDARERLHVNKSGGDDGLVNEMLQALPFGTVLVFRDAFERRLRAEQGHREPVASWVRQLIIYIERQVMATRVKDWRPITLLSALLKWYCGCLGLLLQSLVV